MLQNSSRVSAACGGLPTDKGQVTFNVNIPAQGTYRVWTRLLAPDASNNSIFMQVDQSTCGLVIGDGAMTANTLNWVDYQSGAVSNKVTLDMAAGSHIIVLAGREPNVAVDRVIFATDLSCIPSGNGDNCATTSTTPAPSASVSLTGISNNQTVAGNITVQALPLNATGVSKIEFYVDGISTRVESTSPYCFNGDDGACFGYDTHGLANGTHTIKAVMTAGGGTAQTLVSINVQNSSAPDTLAPSVPKGLTGTALNSAQVKLSWSASTDNAGGSGVAKYNLFRNGILLASIAATSYTDSAVSDNTAYSYAVSAVDSSGNQSAKTASITVKTPLASDIASPSAPSGLRLIAVTANSIVFGWNASTDNVGVLGYHVYRNDVLLASVSLTSYSDGGLKPGTAYRYKVVAYDAGANGSAASSVLNVTTIPVVVLPPSGAGGGTLPTPVSGVITVQPQKSTGAVDITYKIDGKLTSGPTVDTRSLDDGKHTLEATQVDSNGVVKTYVQEIVVDNGQPWWQKMAAFASKNIVVPVIVIGLLGLVAAYLWRSYILGLWKRFFGPRSILVNAENYPVGAEVGNVAPPNTYMPDQTSPTQPPNGSSKT